MLLADVSGFVRLEERLHDTGTIEFDLALRPGLTLPEARTTAAAIARIQAGRFDPANPLSGSFETVDSGLPRLVQEAEDTVDATGQPLRAVTLAGTLVALVVVGGAGAYAVRRRRTEIGLLSARGIGPGGVAVRSAAESALPILIGTVGGWALAIELVRATGPSSFVASSAMWSAMVSAAIAAASAVVLLAAAAAVASRGEASEPRPGRIRALAVRWPWEAAALAAAGASLYEILTRGTGPVTGTAQLQGPPKLDLLVLLFPFLFVAGTAGLAVRWLRTLLPRLKRASSRRRPWVFLAASRLASAPRSAASLVGASALALGVLTYAGVLATSISATAKEKSTLSIGADVALTTAALPVVTGHPSFRWTPVTRIPDLQIVPQSIPADLLAVDPHSFGQTAFWTSRLGPPLPSLMRRLQGSPGGMVPALVAGGSLQPGATLSALGKDVPIDPVASLGDFPGVRKGRITLVLDRETFQRIGQVDIQGLGHSFEVWARGDPKTILPYLRRIGLPTGAATTADTVRTTPAFLALSWTFGVLEAFGVLAGLIAALGVVLYLQARQQAREVSYALARRMGLAPGSHLRSVAAELGTMLGAAFVLGAVFAYAGAAMVHHQLDPIPSLPPSPFLVTPVILFVETAGALALVSLVGAWWVQRRADRANPAEVMRLAR
jgi:putative ABC transport system permease protein